MNVLSEDVVLLFAIAQGTRANTFKMSGSISAFWFGDLEDLSHIEMHKTRKFS